MVTPSDNERSEVMKITIKLTLICFMHFSLKGVFSVSRLVKMFLIKVRTIAMTMQVKQAIKQVIARGAAWLSGPK